MRPLETILRPMELLEEKESAAFPERMEGLAAAAASPIPSNPIQATGGTVQAALMGAGLAALAAAAALPETEDLAAVAALSFYRSPEKEDLVQGTVRRFTEEMEPDLAVRSS